MVSSGLEELPRVKAESRDGRRGRTRFPGAVGINIKEVCMRLKAFVPQVGSGERLSGLVAVDVAHGK